MTTASTKRTPAAVGGKITPPVAYLSSVELAFTPCPASAETTEKYQLQSPMKQWVTGVFGSVDIVEGDVMTVNGVDYTVRAVAKYTEPVAYINIRMEKAQ